MLSLKLEEFPSLCEHDTWTTCDRCARPSGGRHHACERGQSSGERPEAVGAGRPGRRPAGRSLAVREQRRQTQEQVLVEKLQGECVCVVCFPSCNSQHFIMTVGSVSVATM